MIFWPVLLLLLLALAAALTGPPSLEMIEPGHPARLVYATVLGAGVIVALALRIMIRGGYRTLAQSGVWLMGLGVVATGYALKDEVHWAVAQIRGEFVPSMAVTSGSGEVELRRAWDNHYRADALVNGQPIQLLVDTGASMVLIPYETAPSLGINVAELKFTLPVSTANGRSTVASVYLDRVQIGEIEVRNVHAAVARPGNLKSGLLGLSFLDHLSEMSFSGDRLILRQRQIGVSDQFVSAPAAPRPLGN